MNIILFKLTTFFLIKSRDNRVAAGQRTTGNQGKVKHFEKIRVNVRELL